MWKHFPQSSFSQLQHFKSLFEIYIYRPGQSVSEFIGISAIGITIDISTYFGTLRTILRNVDRANFTSYRSTLKTWKRFPQSSFSKLQHFKSLFESTYIGPVNQFPNTLGSVPLES